ncbi:MAG: P-loop domain-containing protein, partial [Elainellaceae cyanobacterium]
TALLLDEDTCATNFMIRDRRMQMLIPKANEPITPFVDRVEALYRDYGVSTIMVMGGSGEYFDAATVVIGMTAFEPQDLTQQAKAIAQQYGTPHLRDVDGKFGDLSPRRLIPPKRQRRGRIRVRDITQLNLDSAVVDLSALQLVDAAQTRAVGCAVLRLLDMPPSDLPDGEFQPLAVRLSQLMAQLDCRGLDLLFQTPDGDLAEFRRFELAAALSRLRGLCLEPYG